MRTFATWFCLIFLILIHSIDMELTRYYIGNEYERETFLPMSLSIKYFGIHVPLWMSRIIMYFYFFFALMNQDKREWFYFLVLVTIIYWTSMAGWVFQLGLVDWNLPKELIIY